MKSPRHKMNHLSQENRLTLPSFVLLALAAAYGVVAGAVVTMYYDVVPLTLLYGLGLRLRRKPAAEPARPVGRAFVVAGVVFAIVLSLAVGVLFGSPPSGLVLIVGMAVAGVYSGRMNAKAALTKT
jgi:hypothetical protein